MLRGRRRECHHRARGLPDIPQAGRLRPILAGAPHPSATLHPIYLSAFLIVQYAPRTDNFATYFPRTTRRYAPRGTRLSIVWCALRTMRVHGGEAINASTGAVLKVNGEHKAALPFFAIA